MKKWLSLLVISAATTSAYTYEICKYCEKKISNDKKICNACQEEINQGTLAATAALMSAVANTQKKQEVVNKAARKLAFLLSQKQIANAKKIEAANTLIKKVNAPEFYETIAAAAPLEVVQYFWPDRKNERVYLTSKKVFEKRNNPSMGSIIRQSMQLIGSQAGTVKLDAPKKARTAFALGRSKKDDSIRFVDQEGFSYSILNAAAENPDLKVLQYFLDQTEGLNWKVRLNCMGSILQKRQANLLLKKITTEKLAEAEQKLKNADDKYDQQKYSKKVAELKMEIAAIPAQIKMADTKAKLLFGRVTRFEVFFLNEQKRSYAVQGLLGPESEQLNNAFRDVANFVAKFCAPDVSRWIKAHSAENQWEGIISDKSVFGRKKTYTHASQAEYTGVVINELPCYVYVSSSTGGEVVWGAGIPHPAKPGFVSGSEKGSFVWKSGVPDVRRLGFISGAKENEWMPAPGFKKKGNRMEWVPGTPHPRIKGLIAGNKVCSWIPDKKHLWVNPKDPSDLSIREDRPRWQEILSGAQAKAR